MSEGFNHKNKHPREAPFHGKTLKDDVSFTRRTGCFDQKTLSLREQVRYDFVAGELLVAMSVQKVPCLYSISLRLRGIARNVQRERIGSFAKEVPVEMMPNGISLRLALNFLDGGSI